MVARRWLGGLACLGVTQKTTWHLAQRIRESWDDGVEEFDGPVEVDETFFGGRDRNKHYGKRFKIRGGTGGKMAVAGLRDRTTNRVSVAVVATTSGSEPPTS